MSDGQVSEHTAGSLLELSGVTKHFGGLAAVQDVDLLVRNREIISIIENEQPRAVRLQPPLHCSYDDGLVLLVLLWQVQQFSNGDKP